MVGLLSSFRRYLLGADQSYKVTERKPRFDKAHPLD